MNQLLADGLHISQGTLIAIALVLLILVLIFYLFGRFRH